MKIYQVLAQNGSYEDKIVKTIICTFELQKAIDVAKISSFDYNFVEFIIWENNEILQSIDVDFGFERKILINL